LIASLQRLSVLSRLLIRLAFPSSGVATSWRHAAALGFNSVVAEDACGAYSVEAHVRSIAFLRSWISPVVSTEAICQLWEASR
jgi:nicotinamidase-related amidase